MTIRAVHFDFDGTLADMEPSHLALYVQAAGEHGIALTEQQVAAGLGAGWQPWATPQGVDHHAHSGDEAAFLALRSTLHADRLRAALAPAAPAAGTTTATAGKAAPAASTIRAAATRVAQLEAEAAPYRLYDDVIPLLDVLRERGIDSVIVSNHVWRLPEIVEALGIGGHFRAVITSARVGFRKPHPAIYRASLAVLDHPPGDVLFVGDSIEPDVTGPRAAGMHAVLIDRGDRPSSGRSARAEHSTAEGEAGDTIRSLDQIPAILDAIAQRGGTA